MNKVIAWTAATAVLLGMSLSRAEAGYTILPPGAVVAGKSIADWTADWWTWGLQSPDATNPISDTTGAFAHVNNNGPVFFIAGNATSGVIPTRNFKVPAGKPILLPLINFFDVEPDFGATLAERIAATDIMVGAWLGSVDPASLFATIDGNAVANPTGYLEVTGQFDMGPVQAGSRIQVSLFGLPTGTGTFPTKSGGYWLMITDLTPGTHVLHFGGSSDAFDIPLNCCNSGTFNAFKSGAFDTITVVPEPASAWLVLAGICGLLGLSTATRTRPARMP